MYSHVNYIVIYNRKRAVSACAETESTEVLIHTIVGLLSAYAYHHRLQGNNYELIILQLYELNCKVAYCACAAISPTHASELSKE